VVELPSLETHDTPAGVSIASRIDDSLFLAWDGDDALIFDTRTDETTLLFAGAFGAARVEGDAIVVLEGAQDLQDDPYRRVGALWRAAFAGGAPRRLAERATRSYDLIGDRHVVTGLSGVRVA
jgi:hypothetical protein